MSYCISELYSKVKKPGIYFNLSHEEYHNDLSLSNSGMGKLNYNPLYFWHNSNMNKGIKSFDTKSLKNGRIFHTLLLEPQKFADEWTIKPNCKTSSLKGCIGEGDYINLKEAIETLKSNDLINGIFSDGFPEVSIFWVDETTGVPCKARLDYLSSHIADLKSTKSINEKSLKSSILKFGYDRQAAFYLYAVNNIKSQIKNKKAEVFDCPDNKKLAKILSSYHDTFIFVHQEILSPFISRADILCPSFLEKGIDDFSRALLLFKENFSKLGLDKWESGFEKKIGVIQYGID